MYKAKAAGSGHCVFTSRDNHFGEARLRTWRNCVPPSRRAAHPALPAQDRPGYRRGARRRSPRPLEPSDPRPAVPGQLPRPGRRRRSHAGHDPAGPAPGTGQAAAWNAAGRPRTVAVNLFASSLVDADLPSQVKVLLADRGLPAKALQLEITEAFLMADRDRARSILAQLRDMESRSPLMTSAPVTARSPTCEIFPSTSSSSTAPS